MSSQNGLRLKVGLAEMLKGGVIMDVVNPEQAQIAQDAGASAVMALERVPSDIRAQGGVARHGNYKDNRRHNECGKYPGDGKSTHWPFC